MIQAFHRLLSKLKQQLTGSQDNPDQSLIDRLPDTMDIRDYIETQPQYEDTDII